MSVSAPRPYHHGNLRSTLLAAAEQSLARRRAGSSSRCATSPVRSASATPPRAGTSRDKQALLDALAEDGFERLGRELREAMDASGGGFDARLLRVRAHLRPLRHRSTQPLLELMFAGKHRPGAAESLRGAADAAFEPPLRARDRRPGRGRRRARRPGARRHRRLRRAAGHRGARQLRDARRGGARRARRRRRRAAAPRPPPPLNAPPSAPRRRAGRGARCRTRGRRARRAARPRP